MGLEEQFQYSPMGYYSPTSDGLVAPVYEATNRASNALYYALPKIDGDLRSSISDFDIFEGDFISIDGDFDQVKVGDQWRTMFIHKGGTVFGTADQVLASIKSDFSALSPIYPYSLLDLVIAAGADHSHALKELIFSLNTRFLDRDSSLKCFSESVLRRQLLVICRRIFHEQAEETDLPGLLREFDVEMLNENEFRVAFDPNVRLLIEEENRGRLIRQLEDLARRLELKVGVDGLFERRDPDIIIGNEPSPLLGGIKRKNRTRRFGLTREIALDLGTSRTRIFDAKGGLILDEPSLIAVETIHGVMRIKAIGDDAAMMVGRLPEGIHIVRPIQDGAISDLDAAVAMIRHFVSKVKQTPSVFRPLDLVVCAPSSLTRLELKSLASAAKSAGASFVEAIPQSMAAAIGARMSVLEPVGSMILTIGGGTSEVAVLSLRNIAYSSAIRTGGDALDQDINSYFRRYYGLVVGQKTVERIKRDFAVASVQLADPDIRFRVKGRDLMNGVPKEVESNQVALAEACQEFCSKIIDLVKTGLENVVPELASDVLENGIVLAGGGAKLAGLSQLLEEEVGLPVRLPEHPDSVVALGIGLAMVDPAYRGVFREV